ncbi:MAG TPA: hypothetical protein VFO60_07845 [Candidatus Dormibacteraeota bacterium]|nr:hypothetical protein [Candidatus Dormibacteraeota bacterium]
MGAPRLYLAIAVAGVLTGCGQTFSEHLYACSPDPGTVVPTVGSHATVDLDLCSPSHLFGRYWQITSPSPHPTPGVGCNGHRPVVGTVTVDSSDTLEFDESPGLHLTLQLISTYCSTEP